MFHHDTLSVGHKMYHRDTLSVGHKMFHHDTLSVGHKLYHRDRFATEFLSKIDINIVGWYNVDVFSIVVIFDDNFRRKDNEAVFAMFSRDCSCICFHVVLTYTNSFCDG